MLHFPILRKGEAYKSVDVIRTPHHQTREMFVEISQANTGLIRRDLLDQHSAKAALEKFSVQELMDICARAGEEFLHGTLTLGDTPQTTDDYVRQLSATTGMPHVMVRRNMKKIYGVMAKMGDVLGGLSRRLDLAILDRGYGEVEGQAVSYFPRTQSLGVVLPNNSPGVHSLWIPSFALKVPLVLKPGSAEPWTPYRIVQALIKAGAQKEAFSLYPASHSGGAEILLGDAAYGGTEPELAGKTIGQAAMALAVNVSSQEGKIENTLATETVFENGFNPLEGGFRATGTPFEMFDQWIEVLPTDQVVAVEYLPPPIVPVP